MGIIIHPRYSLIYVTNDHTGLGGVITQAYCLALSFKFQCTVMYIQSDINQLNFNSDAVSIE